MRAAPFVLIALAASAQTARADDIARGAVVRVEADEIYVNLGARSGIVEGARLRLKRPIEVRHPITRAKIQDWLPLGAADVRTAGEQLSMAVLDASVVTQVKVGDVVEIYVERDADAPPPPPPDTPPEDADDGAPLPRVDPDTVAVLNVWQAQRGAPLPARIAAWEGFLASHGDSPHADAVRSDLETLRRLRDELAPPPGAGAPRPVSGVAHQPPTRARPGAALSLVFILDNPEGVASAWLHHRTLGARTYQRTLLDREGTRTLRGSIPAAAVSAPGVEYFVEVVDPRGEPGLAVAPTEVSVDKAGVWDDFAATEGHSRVRLSILYLDFATFDDRDGDHTDQFTITEADVEYRVGDKLWAIRAGVGAIHGQGGYADRAWVGDAPITGFNYGYAEAEAIASRRITASGRLIAGVGQDGFGLGVEARARIGRPDESNLSFGLNHLTEVGFLTDVRFEVDPAGRIPVGLSVGVTDQPAQGDLAVRLGADLGWRASKRIEPQLRLSYQGRTVQHSGVGAGLGVAFHW